MTDETKHKIGRFFKKTVQLLLNPRFLLCFGLAWLITNGWSYICFAVGTYFDINWLIAVASGYMALLWVPFTPEKLITTAIAIVLLRFLFPNDQKTLGILRELHASAKTRWHQYREKRKNRKGNPDPEGSGIPE